MISQDAKKAIEGEMKSLPPISMTKIYQTLGEAMWQQKNSWFNEKAEIFFHFPRIKLITAALALTDFEQSPWRKCQHPRKYGAVLDGL